MNSPNKTKILITGGGGFLGLSIVKLLLKNNLEVISFSRNSYQTLNKLDVTQIKGDLKNKVQIKNALNGVSAVIHTAGKVGMNGTFNDFYETNFTGTQNLVEAMKELNIKKLIYTSTPSVVFGSVDLINADESTPYPNHYLTHYAHSKKLAEEYVLNSCDDNFYALSLRPHLIFGNGDTNLIPRIIKARQQNKLKIVGNGNNLVDVIYVENVAQAHLSALLKIGPQLTKKAYFIGQGPVNLWTFTNEILAHMGLKPVVKKIPLKFAYTIGFLVEIILKLINRPDIHPPMSRFIALQLGKSHYFNHDQSLSDLGDYNQTNLNDAIAALNVTIDQ